MRVRVVLCVKNTQMYSDTDVFLVCADTYDGETESEKARETVRERERERELERGGKGRDVCMCKHACQKRFRYAVGIPTENLVFRSRASTQNTKNVFRSLRDVYISFRLAMSPRCMYISFCLSMFLRCIFFSARHAV